MSGTAADLPVISDIEAVTAVNRALGPGRRLALQRRLGKSTNQTKWRTAVG